MRMGQVKKFIEVALPLDAINAVEVSIARVNLCEAETDRL